MEKSSQVRKTSQALQELTNVNSVITQCSMRHLYKAASEPGGSYLIDKAKNYERRRCGHHPDDYPEPLSAKDCLASVVDPKGSSTNKNRYVVASQELEVRKHMRTILGTPLLYINRSVMIMEPMARATAHNREKEEGLKFRAGLKRGSGSLKRKREDEEDAEGKGHDTEVKDAPRKKKKSVNGPKGPNPLAVKKPKKKAEGEGSKTGPSKPSKSVGATETSDQANEDGRELGTKRKRKRKPKAGSDGGGGAVAMSGGADDSE